MSLHLKFLDIDHPLTFEESKLRQIEAHALIYLSDLNCSPLSKRLEQANNLKAKTWGQKQQEKKQRFELIYLWYK